MRKTITSRANRRGKLAGVAAVALGLTLALTGCGSDDGGDSGSSSDDAAASDDAGGSGDSGSDDAGSDTAASDDAGSDGGDTSEYCAKLNEMGEDFAASVGQSMSDPEVAADFAEQVREVAEVAPDDVAADWATLADAMETLATIDITDPESAEELQQLSSDLTDASQRLSTEPVEACS